MTTTTPRPEAEGTKPMTQKIAYPSLRAYLEAHIDESWIMRGGDFAGQVRTAKGLLEESQKVALMVQGGPTVKENSLDYPVIEDAAGTVSFPKGTRMLGFTVPIDMPLMSKQFRP